MKRIRILVFSFVSSILLLSSCNSYKKLTYLQDLSATGDTSRYSKNKPDYRLQVSDVLYIKIVTLNEEINEMFNTDLLSSGASSNTLREESLYYTGYTVNENGTINLPIADTLHVKGLTIKETKEKIKNKLSAYLKDAQVTVKLANFRFTVLGEVNMPGIKLVHDDEVNLLEAIAYAGDMSYNGNRENILVMRSTEKGTETIRLDITDKGVIQSENFYIMPNDVVYVEPLKGTVFRERRSDYAFIISALTSVVSMTILILNFVNRPY